jgi:hypothetical protein
MTKDPTSQPGGDAVARFVAMLRETRHVPVNYISADERIERSVIEKGGSTEEQLEALVAQAPAYRWSELAGRHVVLPRAAVWDKRIDDVLIANTPRLEAATRFVARVRTVVPELADLSEPPMIGDPLSPVYNEAVSLPHDGSILQHLVALLGADLRTIFTIERTRFGDRLLHFDRIGA